MEMLLSRRRAPALASSDVNVDSTIGGVSSSLSIGVIKSGGVNANLTSSNTVVLGYWEGAVYVIHVGGVQKWNPDTLAEIGWVSGAPGQTIELNCASYLHKQHVYWGLGRSTLSTVKRYDMAQNVFKTYPTAPCTRGVIYADDDYVYILASLTGTAVNASKIYRCSHSSTGTWETVSLTGALDHALSGGDVSKVGNRIYLTGGGKTTGDSDGTSYTIVDYIDLDTMTVGHVTLAAPGIVVNGGLGTDQPTTTWGGNVIYAVTNGALRAYPIDGAASTNVMASSSANYHCPCMRVGDMFYWMRGYGSNVLNRCKIPGGL